MKQQSENISSRTETIRGVVVPEDWDNQFQVKTILIACTGEREIRVENLERFPALLSMSQQEAIITGTIHKCGSVESIVVEHVTGL
ncbi:hypothetical protein [Pseudodesulfovibrio sediminis]|uniref:Uncharacterized protein n=1 Tax=Pseudodesulfovibrio sediminis TaxID=2810563 RepID=A0ABN6ERJ3_9BACT|nr:hypothetical protein [Pseudodesulfovibrio sediminis]BCS87493.1 hypothetical protein PSDVSF_07350 [Pseudodesulfovibrio sediminis]